MSENMSTPRSFTLRFSLLLSLPFLVFMACTVIPKAPLSGGKVIHVGDGTEDMVLDDFGARDRLLISCADRRHGDTAYFGAIVSYDLQSGALDTLEIHEYPIGMSFRPHGLDLLQVGDRLQLYVVCHDDQTGYHWIACFQILDNQLYWIQNYQAGLLKSPNGVTALADGSFYVTNDHYVRGSLKESFLKQRIAEVIRFEVDGTHKVAFKGLAYGNGITNRNGYLYAAATTENKVYRFKIAPDGMLTEQTCIAKVKGPDNLRWDGDDLLVACHMRLLKFLGHAKDSQKYAPTMIYRIQPGSTKPVPVYADKKGETISAGSTGLIYQDRLFIGQVFGDWIMEVKK
jgi:arylesterase / paraoxonase